MRWLSFTALATLVTGLLSGCALPPVVTIVSLVADVASYASTGKTVTDHGISMVLQKDCALLRGLEGEICLEPDPARAAREREARNLVYDYPGDMSRLEIAQAPDTPANRFAASLAFATDPAVTPGDSRQTPVKLLAELSYLGDSQGPAG